MLSENGGKFMSAVARSQTNFEYFLLEDKGVKSIMFKKDGNSWTVLDLTFFWCLLCQL